MFKLCHDVDFMYLLIVLNFCGLLLAFYIFLFFYSTYSVLRDLCQEIYILLNENMFILIQCANFKFFSLLFALNKNAFLKGCCLS